MKTNSVYPKYIGVLSMIWVSILILGVFASIKTFTFIGFTFSVGVIAYPFVYIFADIFTEVYGYKKTRGIVWTGFFCIILVTLFAYLYSIIPSGDLVLDSSYKLIFKASPIIAIASLIAYFSGELINSIIVSRLKVIHAGKHISFRLVISTLGGQIVDNGIFFTTAFMAAGWYTSDKVLPLIASTVIFCVMWEIIALPFTRCVISRLKILEGIDHFDHGVSYGLYK